MADLFFAEERLLVGGALLFSTILICGSPSLDDDGLGFAESLRAFSSFFLLLLLLILLLLAVVSSTLFCLDGDLEAGGTVVTGLSEVDDSESELLDPDPELVDELPLLLESEEDPELLSVLLLLT